MASMASISAARGGTSPSGNQLEAFDYFLVVDFEATCEKDQRIYPQEIIEFPSVLVDGATGRIESAFRRYVRPKHHPVLTQFCRDLTGIRQEDVDGGVDLGDALLLHDAWLKAATAGTWAGAKKGGGLAVVTWGDWDCRTLCRFKGIAKPPYFDRWINLRVPFEARWHRADQPAGGSPGGGAGVGGPPPLRARRRTQHGTPSCGAHAAGAKIEITGSIAPVPLIREKQQQQKPCISPYRITGSLALPPRIGQQPHASPCSGATTCFCYCGVPSRGGVVAVPGPMQGKRFLGCGNWTPTMGVVCPYVVWGS